MAKKGRTVSIPDNLVDYYQIYSLDRNASREDILKQLRRLQGEIRSNMASGALNSDEVLEKLQEAYNQIAEAVKQFKTDERRKEYDKVLDAAYDAGKIDIAAQAMAQNLYEEIEAMFLKGNYRGAIRKCMEALDNNVRDFRIYVLLAQSYFALNDADSSLKTVENGLQVHPDNMPLLRAGARFANDGKQDYDRAQQYVNRMMEIDPESSLATSEQSYLYLSTGKNDLAYQTIDKYLEKHPNDMQFRRDCAHDMVGYSYGFYTKDPESGAFVIASEEDYNKCLDTCTKAASLYSDDTVNAALQNAKYYGNVEFNDENKESIIWLIVGGIMYLLPVVTIPLGIALFFCAYRLRALSYRPYWQIHKFIMTGRREKAEGRYIMIGRIFTGYMKWSIKWSIKIAIWAIRLPFEIASRSCF